MCFWMIESWFFFQLTICVGHFACSNNDREWVRMTILVKRSMYNQAVWSLATQLCNLFDAVIKSDLSPSFHSFKIAWSRAKFVCNQTFHVQSCESLVSVYGHWPQKVVHQLLWQYMSNFWYQKHKILSQRPQETKLTRHKLHQIRHPNHQQRIPTQGHSVNVHHYHSPM